jgi:hypothetical protein
MFVNWKFEAIVVYECVVYECVLDTLKLIAVLLSKNAKDRAAGFGAHDVYECLFNTLKLIAVWLSKIV